MSQYRNLKVYKKFRTRTWDITTVHEIRLKGNWLKEFGFKIGKEIKVEQRKNKLIITLVGKK